MSTAEIDALIEALEALKQVKQQQSFQNTQEQRDSYNRELLHWLDKVETLNDQIFAVVTVPTQALFSPEAQIQEIPIPHPSKKIYASPTKRKKYLKAMGVGEEVLKRLAKPTKRKKLVELDYTVYHTNFYGRIASAFFHHTALGLSRRYPQFFNGLHASLRRADVKILAHTYVSMMLFTTLLFFFLGGILGAVGGLFFLQTKILSVVLSIAAAFLSALLTFLVFSVYPSTVITTRNRMIKNDLPFAIIHMAAIAGSGTQPAAMFRLLLNAHEYKGLESDLKKLVNYINLFGYDLSTALKSVSLTTPSKRFKDILNGIAATIEAGGSLKSYLNSIAEDTMNTYRLERQKHTEVLSTYSDIYTGLLIAAPLLFLVTLAIINVLGGTIGGLSVSMIALLGTYAVIPFMNVVFILFLNIIQPE